MYKIKQQVTDPIDGADIMDHLFCSAVFTDRVKITPSQLNAGYADVIARRIRDRNEGKCTSFGYVRAGTVRVLRISAGRVETRMLNGDVTFTVQFRCSVCNLTKGSVVSGKVLNTNRFAVLAGCSVDDTTIVHAIIPKQSTTVASVADVEGLRVGDSVNLEIMGSKYELNDRKIKAVARVLDTDASLPPSAELSAPSFRGADEEGGEDDDPLGGPDDGAGGGEEEMGGDDDDDDDVDGAAAAKKKKNKDDDDAEEAEEEDEDEVEEDEEEEEEGESVADSVVDGDGDGDGYRPDKRGDGGKKKNKPAATAKAKGGGGGGASMSTAATKEEDVLSYDGGDESFSDGGGDSSSFGDDASSVGTDI